MQPDPDTNRIRSFFWIYAIVYVFMQKDRFIMKLHRIAEAAVKKWF